MYKAFSVIKLYKPPPIKRKHLFTLFSKMFFFHNFQSIVKIFWRSFPTHLNYHSREGENEVHHILSSQLCFSVWRIFSNLFYEYDWNKIVLKEEDDFEHLEGDGDIELTVSKYIKYD